MQPFEQAWRLLKEDTMSDAMARANQLSANSIRQRYPIHVKEYQDKYAGDGGAMQFRTVDEALEAAGIAGRRTHNKEGERVGGTKSDHEEGITRLLNTYPPGHIDLPHGGLPPLPADYSPPLTGNQYHSQSPQVVATPPVPQQYPANDLRSQGSQTNYGL